MLLNSRQMFRQIRRNVRQYKFTYLFTAALLQLLMMSGGIWLLSELFDLALVAARQVNLDHYNFLVVLTNPWNIVAIAMYLIGVAFLMFLEFSVLTLMIYAKQVDTHFSWRTILNHAFVRLKKMQLKDFLLFVLYLILTIPVAGVGLTSSLTRQFYVPEFIVGELLKSLNGTISLVVLAGVLLYINIRLFFTFPLLNITELSFTESAKHSWRLSKRRMFRWIGALLIYEMWLIVLNVSLLGIVFVGVHYLDPMANNLWVQAGALTIMEGSIFFFAVLTKIGIIMIGILVIMEAERDSVALKYHPREAPFKSKWLTLFMVCFVIGIFSWNAWRLYVWEANPQQEVIAHRGYVVNGVENSIEALQAAAEHGADSVEVDIQLTKDQQLVVMHDYNLKRLAKLNKSVKEMTASELIGLPIAQSGFVSTIPSFDTFVQEARRLQIPLLVEVKPHGDEPAHYADILIAKMRELGVAEQYSLMSLDVNLMETINQRAPEIKVGYVIPIQFGSLPKHHVDFFVIEDFSYRNALIEQARQQQQDVYVWTINDESGMVKYLQRPIAGIITDAPDRMQALRSEISTETSYFERLLRLLDLY